MNSPRVTVSVLRSSLPHTPSQPAETESSLGFYPVAMGVLSFVFLLCSVRTNVVLVLIFVFATSGFALAGAADLYTGAGDIAFGHSMLVACGACFFVADLIFWYLFMSLMFTIMELPMPGLPVGDLSTVVRAKKDPVDFRHRFRNFVLY